MGNKKSKVLSTESNAHSNDTILRVGFLEKADEQKRAFVKQWCVLYINGKLTYQDNFAVSELGGTMCLDAAESVKRTNPTTFEVTVHQRVWIFRCQNEADCIGWIDAIRSTGAGLASSENYAQLTFEPLTSKTEHVDCELEAVSGDVERSVFHL